MIHIELKGPGDQKYQIDTNDSDIIGRWIGDIFKHSITSSGTNHAIQFLITMSM